MNRIMTPGFFLLVAVAATITAVVYFENYGRTRNTAGICGGFLIIAAASIVAAARLHGRD